MQFATFSEYTLKVTFLNGSYIFNVWISKFFVPCFCSGYEDQGFDQLYGTAIDNQY